MAKRPSILMLLENLSVPEDPRVYLEARTLVENDFDVSVICPAGPNRVGTKTIEGVRVFYYPNPLEIGGFVGQVAEFAYGMVVALLYSIFVALTVGFDAIHVHMPPDMNALVARCFRIFGTKIVVDQHDLSPELYRAQRGGKGNDMVDSALRWFERSAIQNADRIIATNESQRKIQLERCGAVPDHCYVVRNGPDKQFLRPVQPVDRFASDSRVKIGYVGLMGFQDGVDVLVDALVELKRRRSDFVAVIVGGGKALPSIKEQVVKEGLSENVVLTGMIPYADVPGHIAAFDICATPDPSNPYNDSCTTIKTMEYMALGKPTVSFDTAENRITAGDSALYATNNDVVEFADHLERLIDDPQLRQSMGEIGRERVDDLFAWKMQKQKLVDLYCDLFLLGSGGTTGAPCQAMSPLQNHMDVTT